jgi:hypothetical protein
MESDALIQRALIQEDPPWSGRGQLEILVISFEKKGRREPVSLPGTRLLIAVCAQAPGTVAPNPKIARPDRIKVVQTSGPEVRGTLKGD